MWTSAETNTTGSSIETVKSSSESNQIPNETDTGEAAKATSKKAMVDSKKVDTIPIQVTK
nr:8122_t:CDS:2 [Entrophospora candida]